MTEKILISSNQVLISDVVQNSEFLPCNKLHKRLMGFVCKSYLCNMSHMLLREPEVSLFFNLYIRRGKGKNQQNIGKTISCLPIEQGKHFFNFSFQYGLSASVFVGWVFFFSLFSSVYLTSFEQCILNFIDQCILNLFIAGYTQPVLSSVYLTCFEQCILNLFWAVYT